MGANPVNLNVQSPSKRFYLVSGPTELAVPKRFADDAKNLFRRSASYRPYRTSSENMGCAASQPEGGANAGLGTPGKKQGQAPTEAEKDEAAGLIQGFATEYSKHKKEKEQDEAAHEIQVQAAAFLAKAQSDKEAKEETAKPKLTLPPAPPPLTVAATAAVDAIAQLSHRLFGGEAPAAAPAAAAPAASKPAVAAPAAVEATAAAPAATQPAVAEPTAPTGVASATAAPASASSPPAAPTTASPENVLPTVS